MALAVVLGLLAGHRPDVVVDPASPPAPEPPAVKAVLRKFAAANLALLALFLPAPAAGQDAAAPKAVVTAQVNAGSVLFDARASVSARPPIWQAVGHPDILLLTFDKGERRDVIAWAPHLDPGDYFFSLACIGAPDASGVPAIDVAIVPVTIPGAAPAPPPAPVPVPGPPTPSPTPAPAGITEPLTAVLVYADDGGGAGASLLRRSMATAGAKLQAAGARWIALTVAQATAAYPAVAGEMTAAKVGTAPYAVVIVGAKAGAVATLVAPKSADEVIARIAQARGTP